MSELTLYPVIILHLECPSGEQNVVGADYSFRVGAVESCWRLTFERRHAALSLTKMNPGAELVKGVQLEMFVNGQAFRKNLRSERDFDVGVTAEYKSVVKQSLPAASLSISCKFVLSLHPLRTGRCDDNRGASSTAKEILGQIFETKNGSDVRVSTRDGVVLGHRAVLAATSPLLQEKISATNSNECAIAMKEFDDHTESMLLKYAYCHLGEEELRTNAVSLLRTAHKYGVTDLVCECESNLPDITEDTAARLLRLAYDCGRSDLFKNCCNFYKEREGETTMSKDISDDKQLMNTVLAVMEGDKSMFPSPGPVLLFPPDDAQLGVTVRLQGDVTVTLCDYSNVLSPQCRDSTECLILRRLHSRRISSDEWAGRIFREIFLRKLFPDCDVDGVPAHRYLLQRTVGVDPGLVYLGASRDVPGSAMLRLERQDSGVGASVPFDVYENKDSMLHFFNSLIKDLTNTKMELQSCKSRISELENKLESLNGKL